MSAQVKFKSYIQKNGFKTDDNEKTNYQFMPGKGEPGWKLSIPEEKREEFLTNYYNLKVKNKLVSGLLEKPHPQYNQVRIDIDLQYDNKVNKDNSSNKHMYKMTTLKKFINKYVEIASEYISIPAKGVKFAVFEKQKYAIKGGLNEKEQYIKDGVHMLCPDLVMNNTVLHCIYDDFVNDEEAIAIVKEFGTGEDIRKVFDKSVISTNCWFLLGSGKPSDTPDNYYAVSKTFQAKFNDTNNSVILKEVDLDMNPLEQVLYFSNFKKVENTKVLESINLGELDSRIKNFKQKPKSEINDIDRLALQNKAKTKKNNSIDLNHIKHLLECLSYERVSTYNLWFNVGVCLFNISSDLYQQYEEWSRKWEKFNRNDVMREWHNKISINGNRYALGLTQLRRYAQEDNPKMYYQFTNERKQTFINGLIDKIIKQPTLNGKKSVKKVIGALDMAKEVARYITDMCDAPLVCVDNTKCIFYSFDNKKGLWVEDTGSALHRLIGNEFVPALKNNYAYWQHKLLDITKSSLGNYGDDDDNEHQNDGVDIEYEKARCNSKMGTIVQIDEFLQTRANRSNLTKDIAQELYDSEFYKKLNENRDVFCCNNVVLDFANMVVRKGLPEDMSTIKTDVDFPLDIDNEIAYLRFSDIADFLDKVYPIPAVQEHVVNIFAESLCGHQRREKFHIHTGSGGNGKSVMLDLLHHVFGGYSYSPDATIFSFDSKNPNEINPTVANVKGKRLIDTCESKANVAYSGNGIKKFTGGDKLTGRHLRNEPISFKSQATWHSAVNDIPDIDGAADGGIARRIEVINYPAKFVPPGDKRLKDPVKYPYHYPADDKFRNEEYLKLLAPYFLRMLWDKYIQLEAINFAPLLDNNQIPKEVTEYTDNYLKESNAIDLWITERVVYKEGFREKEKEFYADFKKFTSDSLNKQFTKQIVIKQVERRFDIKVRSDNRIRYFFDYVIADGGEEYD